MQKLMVLVFGLVLAQVQLAPDGTFVYGQPNPAPDGSFVGGRPIPTPDGGFVGNGPQGYNPDPRQRMPFQPDGRPWGQQPR